VDSNAAALAEWRFGVGRGAARFLCLTLGTGVGGGFVADGELVRLAHQCIGDAGHVIVAPDGPECCCGGRGCAEAVIPAAALIGRYRELGGRREDPTAADVIEAARAGHSAGISALAEAGRYLGVALATLANIFFPDRIAVGGGLSEAGDLLFVPANAAFVSHAGLFARAQIVIEKAALGWQATLAGAAVPLLPRRMAE